MNKGDVITEALRSGDVYYADGAFRARKRFTNAQSMMLKQWGALYDKHARVWRLPMDKIPNDIRVFLTDLQVQNAQKLSQIQMFLDEVQANMPYIVESMIFDNEVITILDDAGKEVKKNVKHLNVIEPELSEEQKKEIARSYTENMRDYVIKDFAQERIPEMRQKVQELVLSGQRRATVQKLLEKEYGIASRKAKFLARNETAIMLAEYKKVTYQEMGFDRFIWSTVMDGKERDRHRELNGKVFSYDDPPIIDERTGQRGLPGQTYNCRCQAIPTTRKLSVMARNSADDNVEWITVKGNHIPIKDGQTKEEAVKAFLEKKGKQTKTKDKAPTIAGVKKGKPMSFKQANKGRVNPNYSMYSYGYSTNCQTCVAVFEARLRGYDIEALPYSSANEYMGKLGRNPALAYIDSKTGKAPNLYIGETKNSKECKEWLKSKIKRGERYGFIYCPEKNSIYNRHIVQVSKTFTGQLKFYDPQNGMSKDERLLEKTQYKVNNIDVSPIIFRVDNAELNTYILDKISKSATKTKLD